MGTRVPANSCIWDSKPFALHTVATAALLNDWATRDFIIPESRLTRPTEDLAQRELQERPLLLLFRFVRLRTCFMADSRGDGGRELVEVPLTAFVVGQIVAYCRTDDFTFSAQDGTQLSLSCRFVCVVALRQPTEAQAIHVAVPCEVAWTSLISRDEFVVGWCHGVPSNSRPSRRTERFRARWTEFELPDVPNEQLERLLYETFVPAGSDTSVDFGTVPIDVVSEFGRILSVKPLDYARLRIDSSHSSGPSVTGDEIDTDDSAAVLIAGLQRGRSLNHGVPPVVCCRSVPTLVLRGSRSWLPASCDVQESGPHPSTAIQPRVATTLGTTSRPSDTVVAAPQPVSTNESNATLAAILALTQTTSRIFTIGNATATARAIKWGRSPTRRSRSPRHFERSRSRDRFRSREPVSRRPSEYDARHHHRRSRERSRSWSRSPSNNDRRGYQRDTPRDDRRRAPPVPHAPMVSPRTFNIDRSPNANYHTVRAENTTARSSGSARQIYCDSPRDNTAALSRAASRWNDGNRATYGHDTPHGYEPNRGDSTPSVRSSNDRLQQTFDALMTGATSFRPPAAELQVHQVARVGPRPEGRFDDEGLRSFWNMSVLDRVSEILHQERLRNCYRVTKVTAKMNFAVSFGTRPLDHFLPPPFLGDGRRSVTNDSTTWSSGDTQPAVLIRSMDDLRATLQCIEETAYLWYPRVVADVFRAVHGDSRAKANSIMKRTSPESYIDQAVISTLSHAQPRTANQQNRDFSRNHGRQGKAAAKPVAKQSMLPDSVNGQVPVHQGRQVCLRFQSKKGCDFDPCKHAHVLVALPAIVASFVNEKYGELRRDHPDLRK
ncbi:hypothetical protein PHYSODRAFT_310552 [Phytophthora sojae]|uniref:Uncharacterized protein n=1 Tax=Phytophthora sojae (strain P6497) TaxID=1094619 RepID=G4YR77_PHYSP|nr:hypothetical protein PHYSODRAFT_310552 [Phytophthora sojae]EGZ22811.1 hypothetical protein PHYSODRAFT_310552 [Phytophthora sojae]|eukprot:XP_009518099.1 hypothetical protein PHYSODRAFT_310552 [Phytophthora sojae]